MSKELSSKLVNILKGKEIENKEEGIALLSKYDNLLMIYNYFISHIGHTLSLDGFKFIKLEEVYILDRFDEGAVLLVFNYKGEDVFIRISESSTNFAISTEDGEAVEYTSKKPLAPVIQKKLLFATNRIDDKVLGLERMEWF